MNILIIDNYDSFTYNLYHLIEAIMPDGSGLVVKRNREIQLNEVNEFNKIIISPGPGLPKDAGISCEIIKAFSTSKSILGVCLGHQAIAEVFGGSLINLETVMHGIQLNTIVTDPREPMFCDCPPEFPSARYHSWAVNAEQLPDCLKITAIDDSGTIMGISHKTLDVKGLQFHPESILTPNGRQILTNWLFL